MSSLLILAIGPLLILATACAAPAASPGAAAAPVSTPARSPEPTTTPIISSLRQGGLYLLMWHGVSDVPGAKLVKEQRSELVGVDLADCETQTNLGEAAKRELAAMAADIAALAIPIGEVLASPYCRALETARIVFGRATPSEMLLRPEYVPLHGPPPASTAAERLVQLKRMLAISPPAGKNIVLVTHGDVIRGAVGTQAVMGETIVVRPDGTGGFATVGRFLPLGWKGR